MLRGSQGYAEQADELIARYESVAFERKHETVLHLLPQTPGSALDIGAGSGADAAWLASQGHRVVAVEPTAAFRSRAMALHPSPSIEWVDDGLPRLDRIRARRQQFGLIMSTAVWMHLDRDERELAMPIVETLLAPNGVLLMTLRHGPVPEGRVMFEVGAEETMDLAQACGLRAVVHRLTASTQGVNRDAGIMWSHLAFVRTSSGRAARVRR
ncbi:MAG TPA: methyltransferase domain-containing protein [Burkholderiaceae bacterium]|jgi:SAM-dependent methyltransferase